MSTSSATEDCVAQEEGGECLLVVLEGEAEISSSPVDIGEGTSSAAEIGAVEASLNEAAPTAEEIAVVEHVPAVQGDDADIEMPAVPVLEDPVEQDDGLPRTTEEGKTAPPVLPSSVEAEAAEEEEEIDAAAAAVAATGTAVPHRGAERVASVQTEEDALATVATLSSYDEGRISELGRQSGFTAPPGGLLASNTGDGLSAECHWSVWRSQM